MCNKFPTQPCKPIAIDVFSPDINITLFGSLAVMIHTHWELLSYWIGKLGDVKVPEGPWRFDPHVFTAMTVKKNKIFMKCEWCNTGFHP